MSQTHVTSEPASVAPSGEEQERAADNSNGETVSAIPKTSETESPADTTNEDCSICCEKVDEAAMHCIGQGGVRHRFHGHCLAQWVEACQRGSRQPSCPNCRGPVEIHAERLTVQIGEPAIVQEFLSQHVRRAAPDDSQSEDGWVRVGGQILPVLETLRSRWEELDARLMAQREQPPVQDQPHSALNSSGLERSAGQALAQQDDSPDSYQIVPIAGSESSPSHFQETRGHSSAGPIQTMRVNSSHVESVHSALGRDVVPSSAVQNGPVGADIVSSAVVGEVQADDPIEDVEDSNQTRTPFALPEWAPLWPLRSLCALDRSAAESEYVVEGIITVYFPFADIFDPQKEIMTNTVQAVLQGKHAVIESPTGTGKTMALLCGALAAQRYICEQSGQAPRIIFCTRTHQQIQQVVKAARQSPYRPWLQIVGSREQGLCIEPDVLQKARDEAMMSSQVCRVARRDAEQRRDTTIYHINQHPRCRFWTSMRESSVISEAHRRMRAPALSAAAPPPNMGMLDVEDLGSLGRSLGACPYFLSRVALSDAELVICPYNYVLDASIASTSGLLQGRSIIIIDEGHNLETHCREAGSVCLSAKALDEILLRVDEAARYLLDFHSGGVDAEALREMQNTIRTIQRLCSDLLQEFVDSNRGRNLDDAVGCKTWNSVLERNPTILDFLEECNVSPEFAGSVKAMDERLQQRDNAGDPRLDGLATQVQQAIDELQGFADALEKSRSRPAMYKIHLEAVRGGRTSANTLSQATQRATQSRGRDPSEWSYELSVLLVNPEAVFETLEESAHCIVIASGTLAPTKPFAAELGEAFTRRILRDPVEAKHVVAPEQLGLAFVGQSSNQVELRCIRTNLMSRSFMLELGLTLKDIFAVIPGGVLVFLPSRTVLDAAVRIWQEPTNSNRSSLWLEMVALKGHVSFEAIGPDGGRALANHEANVAASGGSVLFCVYRGRASEGMSLSDHAVRAVICVGIPLAPLLPAIRCKRAYNDVVSQRRRVAGELNGDAWYNLSAHRAVNQALGRVIRHRFDYGAVVLLDSRWTAEGSMRAVKYLPRWLRELVLPQPNHIRGEALQCPMQQLLPRLHQHFTNMGRHLQIPGARSHVHQEVASVARPLSERQHRDTVEIIDDTEIASQPEVSLRRVRARSVYSLGAESVT